MNGAILSDCKKYRYRLWREVPGGVAGRAVFAMLNPSIANARVDDPTIKRCTGFAARFGFLRYDVINLYSLRSYDPDQVTAAGPKAIGDNHWTHVNETLREADVVIVAWGAHKSAAGRAVMLARIQIAGKTPLCFGINADGSPKHVDEAGSDAALVPYEVMR